MADAAFSSSLVGFFFDETNKFKQEIQYPRHDPPESNPRVGFGCFKE